MVQDVGNRVNGVVSIYQAGCQPENDKGEKFDV